MADRYSDAATIATKLVLDVREVHRLLSDKKRDSMVDIYTWQTEHDRAAYTIFVIECIPNCSSLKIINLFVMLAMRVVDFEQYKLE